MATNTKVGNWLYSNSDIPMYANVLRFLNTRKTGVSFITIAGQPEFMSAFGNDVVRTQGKVKVLLSNLRFRGVVSETQDKNRIVMYKIMNNDDALTLIAEGDKMQDKMVQRSADVANLEIVSVGNDKQTNKTKKVNTMATKTVSKKAPRLFLNPETNAIEAFGVGRPSKLKLANECNADGKFLDPNAALAFAQAGGKSEDKLTKAELLDLLRKVRAERDEALAAVETLKSAITDGADRSDDRDDLDLDAEEVDGESDEIEFADAE